MRTGLPTGSAASKSPTDDRHSKTAASRAVATNNWRRWVARPVVVLAILLGAFLLIQRCVPSRTAVQIGADEGFELAKATLCLKGYKLYSEIWNDQPPLHTFLITQILKHISPSILGPRLVTSLFAAILLAAVFFIVLRVSTISGMGDLSAPAEGQAGRTALLWAPALATALLMVSPGFVELSSSCMLEIPALAPAVAAIGVLLIGRQSEWQMNPKRTDETAEYAEYAKGKCRHSFIQRVRRNASLDAAFRALFSRGSSLSRFNPTAFSRIKEILSGVLFGVAFQIKLVNVILLPLAVLIVALQHRALQRSAGDHLPLSAAGVTLFRSLLFLGTSLVISFVAIDFLIDRGAFLLHFRQSWSSHFAAAKSFEYGSANDHPFDWSIFLKNWDTTLPALLGIVVLLRAKLPALCSRGRMEVRLDSPSLRLSPPRSAGERVPGGPATVHCWSAGKTVVAMVPFAWLALTLIVFATHKPWWSYYYIHIAIPLCWCAAIGIAAAWQWIHRRRRLGLSLLLGGFAICAAGWIGSRVYLQISGIRHSPQTYSSLVLGEIQRLKPFAKFIYADQCIYSFHAGIPMPPGLAVMPLKRLWSGDMTNARVAEEMRVIQPEVILLRNDHREVPFQELIDAEYRVVYQDADHRLYAKRALAKQAGY